MRALLRYSLFSGLVILGVIFSFSIASAGNDPLVDDSQRFQSTVTPIPSIPEETSSEELLVLVLPFGYDDEADNRIPETVWELVSQAADEVGNVRVVAVEGTDAEQEAILAEANTYDARITVLGAHIGSEITIIFDLGPNSDAAGPSWTAVTEGTDLTYFREYISGLFLFNLGDPEAAVESLSRSIELLENSPEVQASFVYLLRGAAHHFLGNFQEAVSDYDQVLAIDPQISHAYHNRGVVYREMGQYAQAIADFNRALEIEPDNPLSYKERGIVYALLGEYDQALADYGRAIELDPDFAAAYYLRGRLYAFVLHRLEDSLPDFNRAIALVPDYAEFYINRGDVYMYLGEYERALSDLSRAIELDPGNIAAYCDRGTVYVLRGDNEQAFLDFERAIELDPTSGLAYHGRATYYYLTGDFDRAIEDSTRAIELIPTFHRAYSMRGLAYCGRAERTGNAQDYERALSDFQIYVTLAGVDLDPQIPGIIDQLEALLGTAQP